MHRSLYRVMGQTKKHYANSICCMSAKHAVLMSNNTDWLARNQINVSDWSDMHTADCCFSEIVP